MTVLEDGCVGSAPVNFQGRPVDFRLRDRRPATKKGYAGSTMLGPARSEGCAGTSTSVQG